MKWMISYFYQIRHFTPNMIPLSTAAFPPAWYMNCCRTPWKDKNGVINGIGIKEFIFPINLYNQLSNNDKCSQHCAYYDRLLNTNEFCPFMNLYYNYLKDKNLSTIIYAYERMVESCNDYEKMAGFCNDQIDTIVLIVHEPPTKLCSERIVLKQIFKENGIELEEFNYEK